MHATAMILIAMGAVGVLGSGAALLVEADNYAPCASALRRARLWLAGSVAVAVLGGVLEDASPAPHSAACVCAERGAP